MTITKKIYEMQSEHVRKFEEEPNFLFVNLQAYEEILATPQSIQGFPSIIAGAKVLPANTMQWDLLFFSEDDMSKALGLYDVPRNDVFIRKSMVTDRKEANNQDARRIGNELMQIKVLVPYQAIESYRQYLDNKNLQF